MLSLSPNSDHATVIVIELENNWVGFIVDHVNEVINIPTSKISEPPELMSNINLKYLTGIAQFNEQTILLINLMNIISEDELCSIHGQSETP